MLFNSFEFLVFFPIVTLLYFYIPFKYRWSLLLAASCYFYMAFIPVYILILATTIIIDYFAGRWIEVSYGRKRKIYLVVSIISTCMVLFVFKYFNFFDANFAAIAKFFNLNYPERFINIILPIGLSFHTFQSLSYVIEVYRGNQKAEKNFGIYSLYVMFYPQLVAGPIERPQNLLHQFYEDHKFNYDRVVSGIKLMTWGMFKKVVIADRLAVFVNQIYAQPGNHDGFTLVIATVFFAFQIYCDFSGYSDIAIGSARVMGFRLMKNFNRPYFSKSISEFWKRWHISLSSWFRDYLYISMGGNRVKKQRHYINIIVTFTVSGLWHGANWTYVVWGALNGFYLISSLFIWRVSDRISTLAEELKLVNAKNLINVLITFSLTCFAWIFFRANSLSDAFYIIKSILDFHSWRFRLYFNPKEFIISIFFIGFLLFIHYLQRKRSMEQLINGFPMILRWSVYYGVIICIVIFGVFNKSQFIYFQF